MAGRPKRDLTGIDAGIYSTIYQRGFRNGQKARTNGTGSHAVTVEIGGITFTVSPETVNKAVMQFVRNTQVKL